MGAASSSDGSPPEELATRLSTWASSEGSAAALAALETAAPALSAALRASDADAVTSALGGGGEDADADRPKSVEGDGDGAATTDSPAPKRARAPLVPFTKSILLHQDNASKVLGYAGYRTVFTLEALCARARPALKGAKLILDVSTESSLTTAARTQNRHELLDARRTGSLPTDTPLRIVLKSTETGAQRRTADVLYKDDRVLFPSPRPRQLFRAASTDPGDRDVERSRASLEAYERERAANLALGCIIVDADSRAGDHAGDITKRAFFRTAVQSSSEDSEAADEATAAALVEAIVEYGEGDSTTPRNNPVAWVTASVTEVNASTGIATIRTEGTNETKTVGLGALREGPGKFPCAAAVVLAHAIADHRNDIVLQIVTSPLMALSPLSFVVGAPGKPPIGLRDPDRATALDHAIASRNIVAIGLLTKNYACSWKRWEAVLSTCHSLEQADSGQLAREGSLVDMSCALRKAPCVFFNSFNAFKGFEEGGALENLIDRLNIPDTPDARLALQCAIVARDGNAARARALFEVLKEKCNAAGTPGTADSILGGRDNRLSTVPRQGGRAPHGSHRPARALSQSCVRLIPRFD